ncbi:hypothetical protein JX266_002247 [Neoarthrinium moseri]|nr:hypothetical protein JX266_002247 [Neoarthrinium moseri]
MPSADNFEDDFSNGSAEASLTFPRSANDIRVGDYILLDDSPCKVTDLSKAQTGKHGAAKVILPGTDIFTGKKHGGSYSSSHNVPVPIVTRRNHLLLDVSNDGYLTLFDAGTQTEKTDVKLPEGKVGDKIKDKFDREFEVDLFATVLSSMNHQIVVDVVDKERD